MANARSRTGWDIILAGLSPKASLGTAAVLLLAAGALDWLISPQVSLSLLYLLPIALVTWRVSRWAGLGTALVCSVVWLVIELGTNKSYTNEAIPFWNAIVRGAFFCLVSWLMAEIIERKRVEQSLRESERRVAEASDHEQRRIGEDLHDGLCQQLVGAAFATRKLAARLADLSLPETKDAGEIADLLGEAISEARDAARGLYLVQLETDGLLFALEELAGQVRSRNRIACEFVDKSSTSIADEAVITSLFRIAQEAVNNAVKHAKASRIAITLTAEAGQFRLEVEDDGVGMPPDFAGRNGMGLQIMNYRARMIGARLDFGARPGGGTVVSCFARRLASLDQAISNQPN